MNNSPVADALRFAVTQTVRALTQPGGIQAAATELRQQAQGRLAAVTPNPPHAAAPMGTASAAVELSPAALLPPVDAAKQLAAARGAIATPLTVAMLELPPRLAATRPGDATYSTEALKLAAQLKAEAEAPPVATLPIANLLRSVSSQSAMANYAAMQTPGMRKREDARPTARATTQRDAIDTEARNAGVPMLQARADNALQAPSAPAQDRTPAQSVASGMSPTATQILRADLAYQEFAPRTDTPARIDLYRFGQREGDPERGIETIDTLGATIYLQLPELGDVMITLAIAGRDVDLAVAAPAAALDELNAARDELVQASQAWGVRVRGVSFVPFDRPGMQV